MTRRRIAAVLAVAVITAGWPATGAAAPVTAGTGAAGTEAAMAGPGTGARPRVERAADGDRGSCRYKVRRVTTRLNVRSGPGLRHRVVDKLYPGDYTWGSCRRFGPWRRVQGVDRDVRGFSHRYYLKRFDRR